MNPDPSSTLISTQLISTLKLEFTPSEQPSSPPDVLKSFLEQLSAQQKQAFSQGTNIRNLVRERAKQLDKMLHALWGSLGISNQLSLIAVGGYGRGELHPFSDIDLLVLFDNEISEADKSGIEQFISVLWDCRLKVGHAVRNVEQCHQLAAEDVTIATNLMESRLICGNTHHFESIKKLTSPDKIWDAESFFDAKTLEQKLRYKKFDGSSFDLEPNVKSSPGGLRDIHLLGWIAQRTYYPKTLDQLIRQNVITKKEYYTLVKCQLYIWKVRFALHTVSGKAEDRLLFDYQKSAAELMGFKDSKNSLAVEKMMKRYYRSALVIRNISDILLQILEERVRSPISAQQISEIDEHFQIVNQRVDAKDPKIFTKDPSQLLRVFQYVARDHELKGITASTLRAIRAARYKITPSFRNNTNNKQLFVEFWHILHTSSRAMFLMKRSGVLADYLEAFRQITGQMQYDMFHNYTVDEHTLFLLKNLSDFADPAQSEDFPLCSKIMQGLKHPELIFLAGLFHDIAKGRGGDHSELGAIDARQFCQQHQMDPEHSSIIEWLVANHLLMSLVAQKRDTSDPKVVQNFAQLVGNVQRLELLYILTVADIRATSHSLWNSWKDSLLRDLYLNTRNYLSQESNDISGVWEKNRLAALELLDSQGVEAEQVEAYWQHLDSSYFAKRTPRAIAWHATKVLQSAEVEKPQERVVVGIKSTAHRSGSEVFVYAKDQENLFAVLTATLAQQNLSIQAANIYTDKSGYCYDSFFVLDENGKALKGSSKKSDLKSTIMHNIAHIDKVKLDVQRRLPRQFKYFNIETKVEFFSDEYTGFTRLELTARDHPGLLAAVGEAFKITKVRLHDARITTLGEKVEDTFIVSHKDNSPIDDEEDREKIRREIIRLLDK